MYSSAKIPKDVMDAYSEVKKAEKRYRSYNGKQKLDTSELLDFGSSDFDPVKSKVEIKQLGKHTAYYLEYPKGAIVIKNYLSIEEQLALTLKCLNDYYKKPNRTNLYIYEGGYTEKDGTVPKDYDKESFMVHDYDNFYFNKKIRWSNVGYQYNWNDRYYHNINSVIPTELKKLGQETASLIGCENYNPESVIINYYDPKNFMGCHLDDGEIDQTSPILSYALGLSCVFLIGGPTKETKPAAIKLDSGDLLIMSGFSRICYHGVPRIIEDSFNRKPFDEYIKQNLPEVVKLHEERRALIQKPETELLPNDELHAVNYLSANRLNFNFRQVYNPGQTPPPPEPVIEAGKVTEVAQS